MHTDAIVTADDVAQARASLRREGTAPTMDTLMQTEPELFELLMTTAHCVAGRLALFNVPHRAVRDTADDLLEVVLTTLLAVRQSHSRLWRLPDDDEEIPF